MPDSHVKGELILSVLDAVAARWGRNGLESIGFDHASYRKEQWYGFPELCTLLARVRARLGNNNPLSVYQLGFAIIKDDPRWQDVFDDQDPADVFLTTKRQESLYVIGSIGASVIGPKHVRVEFVTEETDATWFEFYRGQLQGVLELTGRTGVVHLLPPSKTASARSYDIKWG